MPESENERQYRVLDQMLTAHSVLRDRYGRRALLLEVGLLAAAIALNAFVFAGDTVLESLFGDPRPVKNGLRVASVAALVLAIVQLRVAWAGKRRSHEEAFARLSGLKARYREAYVHRLKGVPTDEGALTQEYNGTMEGLPPIPDRQFARLKAYHLFKRVLSEEISKNPGVPAILVSLRLRFRAIDSFLHPKGKAP